MPLAPRRLRCAPPAACSPTGTSGSACSAGRLVRRCEVPPLAPAAAATTLAWSKPPRLGAPLQGCCCSEPEDPRMAQYRAARDYLSKANSEWGSPSRAGLRCAALHCRCRRACGAAACALQLADQDCFPQIPSALLRPHQDRYPPSSSSLPRCLAALTLAPQLHRPAGIPYATACFPPAAASRLPPAARHLPASALPPAVVLAVAGTQEKLRYIKTAITLYGTHIRCMAVHVFKVGPPGGGGVVACGRARGAGQRCRVACLPACLPAHLLLFLPAV